MNQEFADFEAALATGTASCLRRLDEMAAELDAFRNDYFTMIDRVKRRAEEESREEARVRDGLEVRTFSLLGLREPALMAVIRNEGRHRYSASCAQLRVFGHGPTPASACASVVAAAADFIANAKRLGTFARIERAFTKSNFYEPELS